jgi:hypothetical protein
LSSGIFDTGGASLAYARTWIYKKIYMSSLTGLGPAVQYQQFKNAENDLSRLAPAAKLNMALAIGLKPNDYRIGSNLILDSIYSRISGTDVYTSMLSFELFFNRQL